MKKASATDNTARRTWDKDEFRKKAAEKEEAAAAAASTAGGDDKEDTLADIKRRKRLERDPLHQGLIVQRAHLKSRDYQIDLSSRLGKTQVVGLNAPLSQQAGYYCNICDCVLRDSASYLDHINGKWHNRALGLSMRVEKSTVDQVKQRLEAHKKKAQDHRPEDYLPDGIDKRLVEAEAAEELAREEKRAKKRREREERQAEAAADDGGLDPDMAALMGFGGFGGSKKS